MTSRAETHSDWINKFLVTVHNSAYLKRPDPSKTLALRVKGRQRQTRSGYGGPGTSLINQELFGITGNQSLMHEVSEPGLYALQ